MSCTVMSSAVMPSRIARLLVAAPLAAAWLLVGRAASAQPNRFHQTNLVSDIPGLALHTDPQLVNPWGISFGPTTPFWVSDNGMGVATLYNGFGVKQGLVVTIPGAGGAQGLPTGQVFNGSSAFTLANGNPARFLFADESGTIAAWNGGPSASVVVTTSGASYKGLAISASGATGELFAANFAQDRIDVFDGAFMPVTTSGGFTDPTIPAGFAPFNVQNIGGSLFVTYALRDPITGDDVAGPGNGFVDVFDTNGNLLRRLVSAGVLNSPWGLALAPAGFGGFGGDLLVGNFGDGTIHAFDPTTGALAGALLDPSGNPLTNDGLWGLAFGNGGVGFDPNALYLTAGLDHESHGLFAMVTPVPEPTSMVLVGLGLCGIGVMVRRKR